MVLLSLDANLNLDVEVSVDHAVSSFSLSLTQPLRHHGAHGRSPVPEWNERAGAGAGVCRGRWTRWPAAGEIPIYGNPFERGYLSSS